MSSLDVSGFTHIDEGEYICDVKNGYFNEKMFDGGSLFVDLMGENTFLCIFVVHRINFDILWSLFVEKKVHNHNYFLTSLSLT